MFEFLSQFNPAALASTRNCRVACDMLHLVMIESFNHKGLERLYEAGDRKALRADLADRIATILVSKARRRQMNYDLAKVRNRASQFKLKRLKRLEVA